MTRPLGGRRARTPLWVLAGVLLLGLVVERPGGSSPAPTGWRAAAVPGASPAAAVRLLATLPVKGRAPMTGYERSRYGDGWTDTDHNGCRTRDDVLSRDLVDRSYRDRCVVVAGTLLDPYTHRVIAFRKADAEQVQVDHVVALADAWQTGAQQWSAARRIAFANDPLELLAVGQQVNQEKGGSDAASWLPPYRPFRCAFVTRQVEVKARWGLWVTAAERDAIRRVLSGCR